MGYQKLPYIAGCYAAWSPSLQAAYSDRFPSSDRQVVKIGRSYDVLARIENFRGIHNRLSKKESYVPDPNGKFHTKDWYLVLFVDVRRQDERMSRESSLQDEHETLDEDVWKYLHSQISELSYSPKPAELYSAKPLVLAAQFPELPTIFKSIPRKFLSPSAPTIGFWGMGEFS